MSPADSYSKRAEARKPATAEGVRAAAPPRPLSRLRPRNRTGRCFELAGRYQIDDPSWTLVHGTVCDKRYDFRYAHGWLQRDGWVYDAVHNLSIQSNEYVERFAAEEVATFNRREAAEAARKFGNWGPWSTGTERRFFEHASAGR